MILDLKSCVHRLCGDRRGAAIIIVALAMVVFVGFSAIVVDLGYVFYAYRQLQASTDAAALAGALDINSGNDPKVTATSYSGVSGEKNAPPNFTTTMVSGYPELKCFTSTGVSCDPPDKVNGIVVRQHADVPTFFAHFWGISAVPITATATAGRAGGAGHPADIWVVLDTTASMGTADPNCAIVGATRETCALNGLQTLLADAPGTNVKIGVMTFPMLANTTQAQNLSNCSGNKPQIVPYASASPATYQIVGLTSGTGGSGYQTTNAANKVVLNPNSDLVKAAGGAPGCTGIPASPPGGEGTFYADAIAAAQAAFPADGVMHMIIILSDGDATASGSQITTAEGKNECHEAITAATTAQNAGTTVVTIAYGSQGTATGSSGGCATDNPPIAPCNALRQMASIGTSTDPTAPQWFYSDANQAGGPSTCKSGANSISDLSGIFSSIAATLSRARLLPNNTN